MITISPKLLKLATVFGLLASCQLTEAQVFKHNDADLFLTFRSVPPYSDNNEAVVDVGTALNYVNQAPGTRTTVPGYLPLQLVTGSFSSYDGLTWAVFGIYEGDNHHYSSYPDFSLWLTVPRQDNSVQTPAPARESSALQGNVDTPIDSISANAAAISIDVGVSNAFNTATFVREPIATESAHLLSIWLGSVVNNAVGDFQDNWPQNVENTTPDPFTDVVRSDFYEIRALDNGDGVFIPDPHTGNSGLAYYVGYFEFAADGTMTFTRDTGTPSGPPAPVLSILRTNGVSAISFVTSNTANYTLFFTNAAGLSAPVTNWASVPGTISGDGSKNAFVDPSGVPNRFYRVQAQ
jgi:hypothetical protein